MLSRRHLRALVVRAPALQSVKIAAQAALRKATRRPFEPEFEILRHLDIGALECVVDVGANRGQSAAAIRLYLPTTPMHAFEANAALAERLSRQLAGDDAAHIHACGLSDAADVRTLYIPHYRGYVFDGLASLDREEASGWLNARRLAGFDPAHLHLETATVTLRPLDGFALTPAFLKLDIQGAERAALAGGRATIERTKPAMLIETGRDEDLVRVVEAMGYRAYNYLDGRLQPRRHAVRNTVFAHPGAMRGLDAVLA